MLKIIQNIIKSKATKRPTVADCVKALEIFEAKLAVLLPNELQNLTVDQWQSFINGKPKPEDEPQTVSYTLEDGSVVVVAGVVPPLALIGGSAALGYVVLADKLGTRRQVLVTKPSIPTDS